MRRRDKKKKGKQMKFMTDEMMAENDFVTALKVILGVMTFREKPLQHPEHEKDIVYWASNIFGAVRSTLRHYFNEDEEMLLSVAEVSLNIADMTFVGSLPDSTNMKIVEDCIKVFKENAEKIRSEVEEGQSDSQSKTH